ncbi:hypothetical protein [Spiroplasma citri]|uniref:Hypothetical transmembrane protein n=1 Tax=Spiroplasma citri TaxID=2133 RepID=Q14PC1_SPICI|nr:hypothetical protein [Spiroplasma citri]APE74332.1 hypothetical protein SCITRI_00427 [Spiroplasma citri]QIA66552.1 hypothetical protein GMI18_02005 [Spiroplasma citri]QIA68433.1 hypothetical protein GL298_02125 [Spiroplasma citri]QIA70308.1 hypothetical protein GL981_02130 [Spiroplasma citri]QIA72543.1 hypothetical protein GL982_02145 [Spiroplasma citri]
MNFKHSFNNDSGNRPESNQQQVSLNQGNNFSLSQQQYQQQNGNKQNYNPLSTNQGAQPSQQYQQQNLMQRPPQNIGPQQFNQQSNLGSQYQQQNGNKQNYNPLSTNQGAQPSQQYQQQNLMQRPPQNIGPQQFNQQSNLGSQYQQQNGNKQNYNPLSTNQGAQPSQQYQQQNVNQQYSPNANNWGQQNSQPINTMQENPQQLSGQGTQPQTIAEWIANRQNSTLMKPSDFLNAPIDPNIKVGLGKNMNIGVSGSSDLFDDKQQKGTNSKKYQSNIEKIQCQCKNCVKKARPWLTVFITILIVLAILGGCVGAIYGFYPQLRDWLLKDEVATENAVA